MEGGGRTAGRGLRQGSPVTLAILLLISTPWLTEVQAAVRAAGGAPSQKEVIIIGVYAPADSSWQETIQAAWAETLRTRAGDRSTVTAKFVLLHQAPNMTLQNTREILDHLVTSSASVLLGPYSPILELVTNDAHLPYLALTAPPIQSSGIGFAMQDFTYHMVPGPDIINDAIIDIVQKYDWKNAAVIYDVAEGLQLVGRLMAIKDFSVRAWRVTADTDIAELRRNLIHIRQVGMRNMIVVCSPAGLDLVMHEGLRLSMLSPYYSWVVVSLDPRQIDYEPYIYSLVNYTTFQLYHLESLAQINKSGAPGENLDLAVSVDALQLITDAYDSNMASANTIRPRRELDGDRFNDYIRQAMFDGVTGHVMFDANNRRSVVRLRIMGLTESGLVEKGIWQNGSMLNERLHMKPFNKSATTTRNILGTSQMVQIVTIEDPPFVMKSKLFKTGTGNERLEGFLIELIDLIAKRLNFNYELYLSPDGKYGSKDGEEWNGMIQELITGNASLALGAMSITSERETAVDFAKPYKQKMFSLLMKKPKEKTSIFQFLWPLSTHVWLLTVSSIVIVGFLLRLMDYFSPNSDHPIAGRFNTSESLWFVYGSLVGAGTEMVPRTISGRLLTGAWWFFGLILVSSYTANLAAFLTVTKIDTPIKSIADLAAQNKIKYGTVKGSYCNSMFEKSDLEIFKKMWTHMSKLNPDSMVANYLEGVEKVKEGDYAFIWDQPINKYLATQHCDVMATGEPFDEKGYGIGVPLGASYRDDITMAILGLNENGEIQKLENKWWTSGACGEFKTTQTSGTKELNLSNVAGVFVVVAMGALAALIACMLEFIWRKSRPKKKPERRLTIRSTTEDGDVDGRGYTKPFSNNKPLADSRESNI